MSRVAYVEGQYLPHRSAGVNIEDRGRQFADRGCEVLAVFGGRRIETKVASEAFLASTTVDLLSIARIDGAPVGGGLPGPLTRRVRELHLAHFAAAA